MTSLEAAAFSRSAAPPTRRGGAVHANSNEWAGLRLFYSLAQELGLIDQVKPLEFLA